MLLSKIQNQAVGQIHFYERKKVCLAVHYFDHDFNLTCDKTCQHDWILVIYMFFLLHFVQCAVHDLARHSKIVQLLQCFSFMLYNMLYMEKLCLILSMIGIHVCWFIRSFTDQFHVNQTNFLCLKFLFCSSSSMLFYKLILLCANYRDFCLAHNHTNPCQVCKTLFFKFGFRFVFHETFIKPCLRESI